MFISAEAKLDDARLVQMVALHQEDALGCLYDRYGRLVNSIAMMSIRDQSIAEEIVQDVFIHLWEKAGSYNSEIASVTTWLCSIAKHRSIDELRKRNVRPEKNSIQWNETEDFQYQDQNGSSETEKAAEFAWQQREVIEAIQSLTPEQRDVLALAYFGGYSQSRIAEILNIPLGTAKTRIRLAMQKLRLALGQMVEESSC